MGIKLALVLAVSAGWLGCGAEDAQTRPADPLTGIQGGIGGGGAGSLAAGGGGSGSALQPGAAGRGGASGLAGAAGVPSPGRPMIPVVPPVAGAAAPIGGAPGTGSAGRGAAGGAAGSAPTGPVGVGDRATVEGTCTRWKADRADLSEGTWSGNVMSCDAGDISPEGRANALKSLNLYRWLADMPALKTDPEMDEQAQACALLQRANNDLSHEPPMDWTCWNDVGAKASGMCNISTGPGVSSVDGYMIDPGNATTIGHRRWILSNSIGPTGLGSTDMHSCLMTAGNMKVGKPWMAWPSPGVIPIQALKYGFGQWSQTIDQTGWTVQSDTINLASAQVTVTSDGMAKAVTVTQLLPGYGSKYAIRFNPMDGWMTEAGKTYAIAVTGIPTPINYEVQIADCQ